MSCFEFVKNMSQMGPFIDLQPRALLLRGKKKCSTPLVCQLSSGGEEEGPCLADTRVLVAKLPPAVQAWPGVPGHARSEATSAKCLQGGHSTNGVRNALVGTVILSGWSLCSPG